MTYGTDYPAAKPVSQDPPVGSARDWINWLIVLANAAYATIMTGHSLAGAGRATDSTAVIGTVLLVFVLLPSNLLRFKWARRRPIQVLARLRKPLGISAGTWFVAHHHGHRRVLSFHAALVYSLGHVVLTTTL